MGGTGQVGDPGVTAQLLLAPTLWEQGGTFFSCRFLSPLPLSFSEARIWLKNVLWLFMDGSHGGALPSRDLGLRRVPTWVFCMAQVGWVPDPPTFYFPAESIAACLEDCVTRPFIPSSLQHFGSGVPKFGDGTAPGTALFAPRIQQQRLGPDFFPKCLALTPRSWVCE